MFTVKVDHSRFDKAVARTDHAIRVGSIDAVTKGARAGATYARRNHKHKRRTGLLTSGANLRGLYKGYRNGIAIAQIQNVTRYARFVEYGTRPHQIWPKAGHGTTHPLNPGQSRRDITDIGTHRVALRFRWKGRIVFRRYVNHPGTKPYPFMIPAMAPARDAVIKGYAPMFKRFRQIWRTR